MKKVVKVIINPWFNNAVVNLSKIKINFAIIAVFDIKIGLRNKFITRLLPLHLIFSKYESLTNLF